MSKVLIILNETKRVPHPGGEGTWYSIATAYGTPAYKAHKTKAEAIFHL
jgi:hypothetical protein